MRTILFVGGVLVTVAAVQLFVLSTETDRFFAWTIKAPISAALLGAFYGSASFIAFLSAREEQWSRARVGVPGVIVFIWLTLLATLLHLDEFHLDSDRWLARAVAWVWLVVYALEPVALSIVYVVQVRTPGTDVAAGPRQPAWFRSAVTAQGAVATAAGVVLFLAPERSADVWPWPLGPLVARALGAWLVGFGLLLVAVGIEQLWDRVRAAVIGIAVAAALHLVALVRFADDVDWDRPVAWLLVGYLVSVLATGAYGWSAQRDRTRASRRKVGAGGGGTS